jgi:hypothetical protein
MAETNDAAVSWTSCIRFWVVGGWTLIVVGGLLMAMSTVIL